MTQPANRIDAAEILFVDAGVPDSAVLLAGLAPNVEVVCLDAGRDGLAQITEVLSGRTGIAALHVLGHGGAGAADLGAGVLDLGALGTADLSTWREALSADADILLYGCAVGAGADGQALVERLAAVTGADVAASDDATGAAALGGDWALEVSTGAIEAALPFSDAAVADWNHTLNHFRYGTMSWTPVTGTADTVIVTGLVGWTNNHGHIPIGTPIGGVVANKVFLNFGDGTTENVAVRVVSRDTATNDVLTEFVSDLDGDGTIEATETGLRHTYAGGAGSYTVTWMGGARESARNLVNTTWQQEMNIDLSRAGNRSPVVAAPSVVQVTDNAVFTYKVGAGDTPGDTVRFRYGTQDEFYNNGVATEATRPTGLVLAPDGTITWDVRDTTLATASGDRWQVTLVAEDLDSGNNVLSWVPVDFVFTIIPAAAQIPTFDTIPSVPQSAIAGQTSTYTIVMDDPDSADAPTISVLNPPSNDPAVFNTTTATDGAGRTTLTINFTPTTELVKNNYVLNVRGRDSSGYTADQNIVVAVRGMGLTQATDTGSSPTDAITLNTTPTLRGSAEPLGTITLTLDGVTLGTTTANASGDWTFPLTTALPDGTYAVAATSTDASNVTTPAGTLSLVVDTVLPTAPGTPVLVSAGAGGVRPTVSGVADPNATVTVLADGVAVGTAPTDGSGNWSFGFPTSVNPGSHAITAALTDVAGNVASSAALPFHVNSAPSSTLAASGTPTQGETLSLAGALTDADGYTAVSHQWQRSDGNGGWVNIAGATAATYVLAQDDVGGTVRAVVSYTDDFGTAEQVTSAATTGLVVNVNDAPTGAVTVAGNAGLGEVLTAASTLADADGLGPLSYRWQRSDGAGGWTDIPGATAATYAQTADDSALPLRAVASYTDGFGAPEEVASLGFGTHLDTPPTGDVTVAGTAERGQSLSASNTLADVDGLGPVTYRWQRDDGMGGWTDIAAATGETHALGRDDIGHAVRAVASYTDDFGISTEVASAGSAAVAPRAIPVADPVQAVSDTRALTYEEVRARVADGDSFAPPAGTEEVRLADGTVSFGAGADASYLTRLYGGALGREGDARGLAGWSGGPGADIDRMAVARGFLDSPEYQARHGAQTDAQFVEATYREMLFRDPEAEGQTFWAQKLALGVPREQVLADIADSAEARQAWDGVTGAGVFVPDETIGLIRATYRAAFGRDTEAAGLVFHSDLFHTEMSVAEFGDRVQASPEFVATYANRTDAEFVESLYANALGRAPGAGEVPYYEAVLASGTEDRSDVLLDFVYSPEGREHLNWVL